MAEQEMVEVELNSIERALAALLSAILAAKTRRQKGPVKVRPRAFAWRDPSTIPTRAESEVVDLASDPIGVSCRMTLRTLGQRIFDESDGTAEMRRAAYRACMADEANYGRRCSVIYTAWDQIGSEWDRWHA